MEQINSLSNAKVKLAVSLQQKKYRDKYNLFLLEGLRNAEMAVFSDVKIDMCFYTPEILQNPRAEKLIEKINCPAYEIPEHIYTKISDTKSPQGIMLVVQKNNCALSDLNINEKSFVVILDRLQDPGNIGTLIRTSDAMGATAIICLNGTVDIFAPKVVRSAMGSMFNVPFVVKVNEEDLLSFCQENDLKLYATALDKQAKAVWNVDYKCKCGIILGNEANGISDNLLSATSKIYIPMMGNAESLNVAVAGSMVMYERQRQIKI